MRDEGFKRMKIGVASLIGMEPMPFPELVRWAEANGLATLEVNVGPTFPRIGEADYPGHLDLVRIVRDGPGFVEEALGDSGVRISSLAPMINLLTADESLRGERLEAMRQTIDACAALGVETLVTFAGSAFGMHFWGMPGVGDDHPSNRVADNLRIFTAVYGPLADYAADRGVRIAFETAGRGGPQGNLAHSPELWERMFDALPSPALGLSFDPSHLVWLQIPHAPDLIREFADRLFHVDGKDTEILTGRLTRQGILGSGWWRYRLPGWGQVDWPGVISALRDIGYDDVVSIENEDPLLPGAAGVIWAARYLEQFLYPTPGAGHSVVKPPLETPPPRVGAAR
jgi:sugar phosphate isomerase/epimerase